MNFKELENIIMEKIEATKLKNIKIEWLQNKTEAPMMQGEAIKMLLRHYKGAKKYGYMLLNGTEELLEEGCYYLLQLKTDLQDGNGAKNALIAFKENGSDVTGAVIFKNSDKYFNIIK